MRYVYALFTCILIVLVYAVIGALLGWRHGGGAIPMLILVGLLAKTWRVFTKQGDEK